MPALSSTASAASREADTPAVARSASKRLLRPILMIGGVALILLTVLLYWLFTGGSVSVTDTYIDAATVGLSTDVSGLVQSVDVRDHERVKAGQVLFRLDPARFKIAIDQAKANLLEVVQLIGAARHTYEADLAKIAMQKAIVENDKLSYRRYASLVRSGGVTRSDYDNAKYTLDSAEASLKSMQAQSGVDLAKLSGNPHIAVTDTPQYKAAYAALLRAELDYHNSVVRAPFSGVVTETEKLKPGMYLPAGTAAFGLVSEKDVWVRSEPKETELTWVRPGDKVNIYVDTYPGQVWHGVVSSISPASGSTFSILPAQNASGNWVKVVQRIPLRVAITGGPKHLVLRDGMSAEITIKTGHVRSLMNLF